MTVTRLLHHVPLLYLARARGHLNFFVAYVVVVLLSLHFVRLVAGARNSRALSALLTVELLILITTHEGAILLELDLLDRLALVLVTALGAMTGEVLAARLVPSFINLGDFLTNTVRLINICIHLAKAVRSD